MPDWWQTVLTGREQFIIPGVAGSVLALLFTPQLTLKSASMTLGCGLASAVYLGPLLAEYLIPDPSLSMVSGIGFLSGFIGLVILGGVMTAAQRWRKDPIIPGLPKGGEDD
jgi:hypothetical protein